MEHDLEGLRQTLLHNDEYGASPALIGTVQWDNEKLPHLLMKKSHNNVQKMVPIAVVGHVVEDRLKCGPGGNFINAEIMKFESTKYQLLLGRPTATPFQADFDEAVQNLRKIQAQNYATDDRRNLIVDERGGTYLRFTKNVFEKRGSAERQGKSGVQTETGNGPIAVQSEHAVLANSSGSAETIDKVTEHWPVPSKLRPLLDDIKSDYRAKPLCLYKGEKKVSPENANDILKGALVEIHFELRHFPIWKPPHDSYNGTMVQVIILQPGAPDPISVYKREDDSEGPIRKKANIAQANEGHVAGEPSLSDILSDDEQVENSLSDVSDQDGQNSQAQPANEKDTRKGKGKQL